MVSKKFIKKKTIRLKKIGENLIPELSQTAAKKPSQFSQNFSPVFLESGNGAMVKDIEGNIFLDTIMGVGPLILGYNHPDTNKAIKSQLKKGIVFSLINPLEVELAIKSGYEAISLGESRLRAETAGVIVCAQVQSAWQIF